MELMDSWIDIIDRILSRFKVIKQRYSGHMTMNTFIFFLSNGIGSGRADLGSVSL
jgi:hypothetical protein